MNKHIALIILDGWGIGKADNTNAIHLANTPVFDSLLSNYPNINITASGLDVGLPVGQMGNSEVGHLNIGAGRIVNQSLTKIDNMVKNNELSNSNEIASLVKDSNNIHVMGLLSDGGIHSHINHIINIINVVKEQGKKVFFHAFSDGRDVSQKSFKKFSNLLKEEGIEISTISGRFFAMDRDQRWDRTESALNNMTQHSGNSFTNIDEYVDQQYNDGHTDEFIQPGFNSTIESTIQSGDGIIFANFRPDRARQLSHMLVGSKIYNHTNEQQLEVKLLTLAKYDGIETPVIVKTEKMLHLLGDVLAENNLSQLRAAETEKYPHVTFFFDGGVEVNLNKMKKLMVDSPKVLTYDLQPEMSAKELTTKVINEIENFDVSIINYANADMVGHTGKMDETIKAVEAVDTQLGLLLKKIEDLGGTAIITADHGNADHVLSESGEVITKHSTNDVPLIITSNDYEFITTNGKLADIAPTMLKMLSIEVPTEMNGNILIKKRDN